MGQYYVAVILGENDQPEHVVHSWDYNSGMKLTEHSYLDNRFVAAVETLLLQEAPIRVVWAGDYADPEKGKKNGGNLYSLTSEMEPYRPAVPGLGETTNYYSGIGDGRHIVEIDPEVKANAFPVRLPWRNAFPYLINWDRKLYVDKGLVPWSQKADGGLNAPLHPLPILTAEGNGRGGGDLMPEYYLGDASVIGTWARDHLSLGSSVPNGFSRLNFDLARKPAETETKKKPRRKKSA